VRFWHILVSRLRSVFSRDRREDDLREELQFHLEREAERLEAAGLPPDTARLQALRLFGGAEQIKEECRDARGTAFVDDAIRDVRYALRGFRRTPLVALGPCPDHDACAFQDLQVMGEQVAAHPDRLAQLTRRGVTRAQPVHDRQPHRLTQRRVDSRPTLDRHQQLASTKGTDLHRV